MRSHRWLAGSGGGGATEYPTYGDLPASAADDALAIITSGPVRGVWQFVASVDGYPLDMWLPGNLASRITGYVETDSNDPYRYSHSNGETLAQIAGHTPADTGTGFTFVDGGGGNDSIVRNDGGSWITDGYTVSDTVTVSYAAAGGNDGTYPILAVSASTIEVATGSLVASTGDTTAQFDHTDARGWYVQYQTTPNPAGAVYDVANGIRITSGTGQWARAVLGLIDAAEGADLPNGALLWLVEIDCTFAAGEDGAGFLFGDGNLRYNRMIWSIGAVENRFGFINGTSGPIVGSYYPTALPSFERMLGSMPAGPQWTSTGDQTQPLIQFWPASLSREAQDTTPWLEMAVVTAGWTGTKRLNVYARKDISAGSPSSMDLRELHCFHLATT